MGGDRSERSAHVASPASSPQSAPLTNLSSSMASAAALNGRAASPTSRAAAGSARVGALSSSLVHSMSALSLTSLPVGCPCPPAPSPSCPPPPSPHSLRHSTAARRHTDRSVAPALLCPSPDGVTTTTATATAASNGSSSSPRASLAARDRSSGGFASLPTSDTLLRAISSVAAVASPSSHAATAPPHTQASNAPDHQPPVIPSTSPPAAVALSNDEADGIASLVHLLSSSAHQLQHRGAKSPPSSALSLLSSSPSASSEPSLLSLEESKLDSFLSRYARCYSFPHPNFHSLFSSLLTHRLLPPTFDTSTTRQHRLRILRTLRVLTRDSGIQRLLMSTKPPLARLLSIFRSLVPAYFASDPLYCSEMLVEVASICKRLAEHGSWQRRLLSGGVAELVRETAVSS